MEALSLPLAGAAASPTPDAPHNARAYEFYLRANELARTYDGLARARDLYQRCLELDPSFAPAWAHLGRCHRVIGKFIEGAADSEARAEEAFRRALELNPRLSVAHKFYANLEADIGQAQRALVRLLGEATRHGNDPELFAGLVHACRYCGLYEQSIAAHAEARRLDPNVPTSVEQTLLMTGDIDRLLAVTASADRRGRRRRDPRHRPRPRRTPRRGAPALLEMRQTHRAFPSLQSWTEYLDGLARPSPGGHARPPIASRRAEDQDDPEAIFQEGWLLCDVGEHERGLGHLRRAVDKGYFVAPTLSGSRQFDALRNDPASRRCWRKPKASRRAGAGRVPRGRRRTTARPVSGGGMSHARERSRSSEAT